MSGMEYARGGNVQGGMSYTRNDRIFSLQRALTYVADPEM